ncbi:MAG: FAD-dependent oxidoreductase, partial [Candidatus Cloacimonadaceae bacterium]|nr:FAD-dependent oxidoreductase [Candidatus Cloacimonadaceae bacterium]
MYLTDAQLKTEIERCEYCEEKPCKTACPCDCSPADFIMAAAKGKPSDYKRAAGIILSSNPLGGICGDVCPDYHCMKACSRTDFDTPINIPAVQSTIINKARELNQVPEYSSPTPNGKRIGIIGAGPAAIGSAITLIQSGYEVELFEADKRGGGAVNLIPDSRLHKEALINDLEFLKSAFSLKIHYNHPIENPDLLAAKYDALIVAAGLDNPIRLNIPGDEAAFYGMDILKNPQDYDLKQKRCAIVGGAIAADIALTAVNKGAAHVEMIVLESYPEMPLTKDEKEGLLSAGIHITNRTRITEVVSENGLVKGIRTCPVTLPAGETFHPSRIMDEAGATELFRSFDIVVFAVGNRPSIQVDQKKYYVGGDMVNGPTTVVEAVAAGKNLAIKLDADLMKKPPIHIPKSTKSEFPISGWKKLPIDLKTDFFGRSMDSPFLLSAAPPTDGYEQMKKAYQAGWSGGIMKTAFDDLDIHIPGEYMFVFDDKTWANCDNVSDHPLKRVCSEIQQLVAEFPEKLTMASTGGPVTGNDDSDKKGWQSNTRLLEQSGVMGIEYSLSCPQGGDGTHGDIVAQNAELSAKIIDWVMEMSDPDIPKLFKLTGAVTAIYPIIDAIRQVFDRYPGKKAGVTLANTFPTLAFRDGQG